MLHFPCKSVVADSLYGLNFLFTILQINSNSYHEEEGKLYQSWSHRPYLITTVPISCCRHTRDQNRNKVRQAQDEGLCPPLSHPARQTLRIARLEQTRRGG